MTSRTGDLLREVRTTPLFRGLVPMESGIGWPIPLVRGGAVFLRLPIVPQWRRERDTALYPPAAVITVEAVGGRPVEYEDLYRPRPDRPVGTFPHDAVRGTVDAYRADRERLLTGYDELVDALATGVPFTGATGFAVLLARLVEPDLLPYYRELGPEFYTRFLGPAAGTPPRP